MNANPLLQLITFKGQSEAFVVPTHERVGCLRSLRLNLLIGLPHATTLQYVQLCSADSVEIFIIKLTVDLHSLVTRKLHVSLGKLADVLERL
jgi:hypothetical protein